ncbi:unnamed protein product [Orchesella dallaii]|uniref:Major facilitator superfamily (MFS) profile domain-containing protein n=1 Tax=Orchesella dallaii TaxID=48710 RepID=A0ABP1Q6F1_9HEXA
MGFSSTLHIFISVLCDNLLLTVVVPILPELLRTSGNDLAVKSYSHHSPSPDSSSSNSAPDNHFRNDTSVYFLQEKEKSDELAKDCLRRLFHLHMLHENSQLGLLFSTKALVQLFANPLVGSMTFKVGYKIPLCIGNFILFLCSLVFAFANSYGLFVVGRSFHGLASSLISVSGMALVAEAHPVDEERTRFLGRVMGSSALGVLIGYPFGGITFALFGKLVPFLSIALIAAANVGFQLTRIHKYDIIRTFHPEEQIQLLDEEKGMMMPTTIWTLFKDKSIKIISIAVWLSTTAMAVLEPTLPVWLMENMNPPKWQLGLVFVPDSLGYFFGTNFFGEISLRLGRWKMSMISLAAIGISCFLLPTANKVWKLAFPHFTLGLGLGIVDASLMPLLARIADDKYHAGYGAVYALAQTSVALAYSLGPLMGGELVPIIGFPDLIRSIGFLNLLFCPFLFLLSDADSRRRESSYISPSSISTENAEDEVNMNANPFNSSTSYSASVGCRGKVAAVIGDLLPLKSYNSRFIQSNNSSLSSYQRFHDQLDSD